MLTLIFPRQLQTDNIVYDECGIYLIEINFVSFFFLQHDVHSKKSEIDEKTREEILSLIAHHVTAVNYIYRNTKFDGRVEHRNIRFEVGYNYSNVFNMI